MFSRLKQYLNIRKKNHAFLRKVADDVGAEIEQWSFAKLSAPAEELSFSRQIDGVKFFFAIEAYETNKDGDLHVSVDVDGEIPIFPFIRRPSYVFWKSRDEKVYY